MFDIRIIDLNVRYYMCMTPEKALAKAEKDKKNLYLQAYLDSRFYFNHMVYSADGIPRAEALVTQNRLVTLLRCKLKQEYSKICGFVRASMSLVIFSSNSLFLHIHWYKEAHFCQ